MKTVNLSKVNVVAMRTPSYFRTFAVDSRGRRVKPVASGRYGIQYLQRFGAWLETL